MKIRKLSPSTPVFLFMGVVFLVVGISLSPIIFRNTDDFIRTTAVISDISIRRSGDDTEHDVRVDYTIDGERYYDVGIGEYESTWRVGKTIDILVNPEDHYDILTTRPVRYGFLIFPLAGVLFIVMCFVPVLTKLRGSKMRERFRPVYAKIDRVDRDTTMRVNGRNPYRIYLSYLNMEDGQLYKFKSGNIWNDPTADIDTAGLTELPVYVNWSKPTRYFVDTEVIFRNIVDLT